MKIAMFTTNLFKTPPTRGKVIYAPMWISHHITEGLHKKGHEVYVFGSSDSNIPCNLISDNMPTLKKNTTWNNAHKKLLSYEKEGSAWAIKWREILKENYQLTLISKMYQMAQKGMFDIIQFHSSIPSFLYFAPLVKTPTVLTVHDPLAFPKDTDALKIIYSNLSNVHFVSISEYQKSTMPKNLNYAGNVYNGNDTKQFSFQEKKGDYLLYTGRITEKKGVDVAVRVAKKLNKKLKIAGAISADDMDYWKQKIQPHLSRKITHQGIVDTKKLTKLYQNAEALLMPIKWDEPFGLVMTEAMACGTPVIAFNRGSVPEVVKHNKTGFIVKNEQEMIEAVNNIDKIKKQDCREWVENNFSIEKMVDNYEKLYLKILKNKSCKKN